MKKHTKNLNHNWGKIRAAYETGIGVCEIERKLFVPAESVTTRAKKERWNRAKFDSIKDEVTIAISKIQDATIEVHAANAYEQEFLSMQIDSQLQVLHSLNSIVETSINAISMTLNKAIERYGDNPVQMSKILAQMGLTAPNIARLAGVTPIGGFKPNHRAEKQIIKLNFKREDN